MSDQLAKDLETLESLNRMANQETLPAVEDAKIGTPVEEVEKALVEYYKRELSYMTEIGQMHLESLWLEIEHRIPEMKTGELINTLQAMKQLHNDELSKSTSPIVSLLTKKAEAEIAEKNRQSREYQAATQIQINTGNTSPEQMRSINEEADTRVVQGLLTISNILEKYREKKVSDDAKNVEEAEVVSTEESKS